MSAVAAGLDEVRDRIATAACAAGRSADEVTLVAVSKTFPVTAMREAMAAGQRIFGENRVQEAVAKYKELGAEVRWHFIGRLQRNKARQLVSFVDLIHSVDREDLAAEIDQRVALAARPPMEVLIEVNTSGEPAKGGVSPAGLLSLLESLAPMRGVRVAGLMGMAPILATPGAARPYFRRLADLAELSRREFPEMGLRELSMGMSQDYMIAVEEGATLVRIGEAIFGRRKSRTGKRAGVPDIEPATEGRAR
jgi:pyridoxal phosphate enzyme (YggS family)